MKKKIFFVALFITPLLFFWGKRLLELIIGNETHESLKIEIITAIFIGYGVSLGLWNLYRKANSKSTIK